MELPFLVVHGAVVWKVLLGVLVAIIMGSRLALRVRRARRSAREDLAARALHLGTLEPGRVMIRGKLARGSVATLAQSGLLTDHRTDELVLDQEGARVAIEGPLRVEHGSRTKTWFWRTPRETPEPLAKAAKPRRPSTLREVRDGDEVIVHGRLERRADGDVMYRESAASWTLTPDTDGAWIAAATPRTRAEPLHPVRWIVTAIVATVSSYILLHAIGHHTVKRAAKGSDEIREPLGNGDLAVIASAMPGSREKALRLLSWRVDRSAPHTEEWFQLGLKLAVVIDECPIDKSTHLVRLEEALATARRCGRPADVARVLAFLGRYDEVTAGDVTDSFLATVVAIATGRWPDAARGAELRASEALARERSEYYTEADAQRIALELRCTAMLFRSWAGDASAGWPAGHETSSKCRVFAALTLPVDQQAAALAAIDPESFATRDYMTKDIADAIRVAAGGAMSERELARAGYLVVGEDPTMWLAPFALAPHASSEPQMRSRLHAKVGALATYRADFAMARRELDATRRLDEDMAESLAVMLALYEGTPVLPPRPDHEVRSRFSRLVDLRNGKSLERNALVGAYPMACEDRLRAALETAQGGDGGPLAAVLESCNVYWNTVQNYLIGILPRVTKHRERLAAALRLYRNDISMFSAENLPFRFLDDVVMYRDLAHLAGDREEAAHWQQVFDRHATLLADRQKLIALLFWAERY